MNLPRRVSPSSAWARLHGLTIRGDAQAAIVHVGARSSAPTAMRRVENAKPMQLPPSRRGAAAHDGGHDALLRDGCLHCCAKEEELMML